MLFSDKQKKPHELLEEFEIHDLPPITDKSKKASARLFRAFLKYISPSSSNPLVHELHQIKINLSEIKELKLHAHLTTTHLGKDYTYNFQYLRGKIIPEYLYKGDILDCSFLDVSVMRYGEITPKNKMLQLFTAITIMLATILESILEDLPDATVTLKQALSLIDIGNGNALNKNREIDQIIENFIYIEKRYRHLIFLESKKEDLNFIIEFNHNLNIDSSTEDFINYCSYLYIEILQLLEETINTCIDIGLLEKYQRSDAKNKKLKNIPVICSSHSLLNNKNLLKRLNSKALNQEGNLKKSQNFAAIDQQIIKLIMQPKFEKKYKNKSQAAEKLSDEILEVLEIFMEKECIEKKHRQMIKHEGLPKKILILLNKNKDLANHVLSK